MAQCEATSARFCCHTARENSEEQTRQGSDSIVLLEKRTNGQDKKLSRECAVQNPMQEALAALLSELSEAL
eukprot:6060018-Amphidinium_carterae.1